MQNRNLLQAGENIVGQTLFNLLFSIPAFAGTSLLLTMEDASYFMRTK